MSDSKDRGINPVQEYWRIVLRRKTIIILFGTIVVLTTVIGTLRQQKEYEATTTFHVNMNAPRVVDFEEPGVEMIPRLTDYQAFYNTQYEIVNSRGVKRATIERLKSKGYTDWDEARNPIAAFSQNMEVTRIKRTRLLQISYTHTDPVKAAEIANTLASVYIQENLNRKVRTMSSADEWLQERAQDWRVKMRESDERLLNYKKDNDLLSMEHKENIYQDNLTQLYRAYNTARVERIAVETEYQALRELYDRGDTVALISYYGNQGLRRLRDQYNDVDRKYQSLSDRYLPKYPTMMELDNERKVLEIKISDELKALLQAKQANYEFKRENERSLLNELNQAKKEAAVLETKIVAARVLVTESERNQRFFKQLDERQSEIDMVGLLLLKNSNIEIIDEAVPPVAHIRPRFSLNLFLALLVSGIGGIGLAIGSEYLDKTLKSPQELEGFLRVPLLGIFPSLESISNMPRRDTYVHENPKSSAAECMRSVRTNLILGLDGRQLHSMLVTSALPREGKSTIVVSLGVTMAVANNKTLLVDTDLRRPRLHKVFGVGLEKGLTSLLHDSAGYDDVVYPTDVPNLYFMPSGPVPVNPSELLGSAKMQEVLTQLEERYDLVIFDSPPAIPVTDAIVLSALVDGVVFVIKQGATTKDTAMEATRRLQDIGENLLGCVMNSVDIVRDAYGYRYYYYYHYYGEDDGETIDA